MTQRSALAGLDQVGHRPMIETVPLAPKALGLPKLTGG